MPIQICFMGNVRFCRSRWPRPVFSPLCQIFRPGSSPWGRLGAFPPFSGGVLHFLRNSFFRGGHSLGKLPIFPKRPYFLLTLSVYCARLYSLSRKGGWIAVSVFAYTRNSASAQADCAFSSCPNMTNISLILDAGLLLASIIILPIILLVLRFKTESHRIPVQRAHSSPALQAA